MSGTLGPAKSWRVVYNDTLFVTFFEETDGMLYTGQTCFEFDTKEECITEMRRLGLKFESWKFCFYPDNSCTDPIDQPFFQEDETVEITIENPEVGYIVRQSLESCINEIVERGFHVK
jgi:hypothetical protein